MKNKNGISLIVLIITIIIIIILSATVVLSLSNNNPIENAEKARILSDIDTFRTEFSLAIGNKYADTNGFFDKSTITDEQIDEYIPSIDNKEVDGIPYKDIITIEGGEFGIKDNSGLPEETEKIIIEIIGGTSDGNNSNPDDDTSDDNSTEITPDTPEVKNTYTVTYDLNGGEGNFDVQTKNEGEILTLNQNQPTKLGYTFDGWKAQDGSVYQASANYEQDENTTLTAQWKTVTYTITYNLGGGNATNKTTYTIETETFSLTMPTRTNYTFTGWTGTDISSATKTVTIAKGSVGDRTYTANWIIENNVPVFSSCSTYARSTDYISIKTNATDSDGDKLTYKLYLKTTNGSYPAQPNVTSSSTSSGTYVYLQASGLSAYTVYNYKVEVTDGVSTISSSEGTTSTGCNNFNATCSKTTSSISTCGQYTYSHRDYTVAGCSCGAALYYYYYVCNNCGTVYTPLFTGCFDYYCSNSLNNTIFDDYYAYTAHTIPHTYTSYNCSTHGYNGTTSTHKYCSTHNKYGLHYPN